MAVFVVVKTDTINVQFPISQAARGPAQCHRQDGQLQPLVEPWAGEFGHSL